MKLGIFTDSHYSSAEITCSKRYNSKSLNKIKEAYDFFEQEKCDLVICLGDLIDKEDSHKKEIDNLKELAKVIGESPIKTVCVMGNHDGFAFTRDEFYDILPNCQPIDMSVDGKSLMFLDACYLKSGRHYAPGDTDWTDTFYPKVEELEEKLRTTSDDVYIFIHQNLDTNICSNHCVFNACEINGIIAKYQCVKAVFQGHFHSGNQSMHNSIRYVTFSAMCENDKAYFIEEI